MLQRLAEYVNNKLPEGLEERNGEDWSKFHVALAIGCTAGVIVLWAVISLGDK